jgi:hypothetical protein
VYSRRNNRVVVVCAIAMDLSLRTPAQVGVAWYFGIHLGLDNRIGG